MNETTLVWYAATHNIYLAANHLTYAMEFYQKLTDAAEWAEGFNQYTREQEYFEGQRHFKVRVHGAINCIAVKDAPAMIQNARMLLAYTYELVDARVDRLYSEVCLADPQGIKSVAGAWCFEAVSAAHAATAIVEHLWRNPPTDLDGEGEDPIEVARKAVNGKINLINARAIWLQEGHAPA